MATLRQEIKETNSRFDSLEEKTTARIDAMAATLTARIDALFNHKDPAA